MTKFLPIVVLFILSIGGLFVAFRGKVPLSFLLQPSPTPTRLLSTTKIPSSYKIENIPYTYGATGCCYCAGITAMMGYRGMSKQEVENYWQDIKATNYEKDPMISLRLLPKYGLSDKFHVAWLNPTGSQPRFMRLWQNLLTDYQKRVHFLKTEEEAFNTLKELVSQNIPTMVAYEEPPNDTFHLVSGFDEQFVYYWTLPGKQTQEPIAKFLSSWKLAQEEFPYPNFPGHYTMMWLER